MLNVQCLRRSGGNVQEALPRDPQERVLVYKSGPQWEVVLLPRILYLEILWLSQLGQRESSTGT